MPILDGQSHRYNLMQAIKANGGQKYETEPDTSVHPRGRRALGAPGNTGRGGGVIGSRGRQQSFSQKSYVLVFPPRIILCYTLLTTIISRSNSTGTRGKARAAAGNLFMPSRPRDPARDSNNPQSPPRRGARGRANVRRPSTIRQRIPIVPHP